jgi:phage terminase small subunit
MEPDIARCWQILVDDLTHADVIDHADAGVIEAAAVFWGRARQARSAMMEDGQNFVVMTPQGVIPNRLLTIERESWREFRALADSLPISPWGRARLGLTSKGPRSPIEDDIGQSPRKLRVVNGEDEDG